MFGTLRNRTAVIAASGFAVAGLVLGAAGAASASTDAPAAPAITQTCNACVHIQNDYAFRGALDAVGQATAINSPISLWYEKPTTTDAGADLLPVPAGTVTHGIVNQSSLDWSAYNGDSVVRFKYDPYGNGGANTYIGLQGPSHATWNNLALRADNPDSVWQEFIVVPTNSDGVVQHSNGSAFWTGHYALIDVGQSVNPLDPMLVTDPHNAITGSLVQQDVEPATVTQNATLATTQVWDTQN